MVVWLSDILVSIENNMQILKLMVLVNMVLTFAAVAELFL